MQYYAVFGQLLDFQNRDFGGNFWWRESWSGGTLQSAAGASIVREYGNMLPLKTLKMWVLQ